MLKGEKIYLKLLERKDVRILKNICDDEKVRRYNTISNESNNSENTNFRKALTIINEKEVLVGFITYKESNYCKDVYSIGITIGSRYWNRGYGQDSIKLLLSYLFNDLNAVRVELEVISTNIRAITCYKKCGFLEEGIKKSKCYIDGEYVDTIIMGIIKNEFIENIAQ
ncbi:MULTISPECIES: GNAT family N-acetyltransferase [Clostridium]|uniref:GNAT family N-acetyltransferase n=1 Tax=Clostridium butyricum TaxID=1492 RepID=A0AAP9UFV2_CLOBU|nr:MULTISPECIES: GNAT family protein [Clostridium]ALP88899.1 GCN5 family acetyltransferase [Clostridium butyricum]ALS15363.1 GCN5 family acetyltransferase [Clostridium butyricum]ANF12512.1 GCN5 family acetyltransferase [Clostridium butyricum]AOR92582.1 GCN5 family acetyltransferase [Clostridium butyricum]AXB86525.1 N-acetyltransferase [Clostridium butyricum]